MNDIKASAKISLILAMIFFLAGLFLAADEPDDKKNEQEKDELKPIIEAVVVTGETPAQQAVSTVSIIKKEKIEKLVPKNLGNVMNQVSGAYVTEGAKNEADVKIRGLSSSRITLMYDGIPIYEPYFNTFDLKSITAAGLDNIKIIKGAGSVLYGPNTLGGVIDVLSERPTQPFLTLNADAGENKTYFLSGSGGYSWEKFAFFSSVALDRSDGFDFEQDGERIKRANSDYKHYNFAGKFYFYPTEKSEIMAQVLYHTADYGIPAAAEFSKARCWHFDDWNRRQVNLGGFFPFLGKGLIKMRSYYVYHYNVLDAYTNADLAELDWVSTYRNNTLGAFILGEYPLGKNQELKFSLNAGSSKVRQQGDIGGEWEKYDREIYSAAVEDRVALSRAWKVLAGVSVDHLVEHTGETETMVNPIIGLKFTPSEWSDFHFSFARKSHFPSMRSLYSIGTGNPDLTAEVGNNCEIGFIYMKKIWLSGAVFYNRILDMIQSYRGLDGYPTYRNVGRANIYGLELEIGKKIGVFDIDLNYTYLNAMDRDAGQPLDYTPKSRFNIFIDIGEVKGFSLSLWASAVSVSEAKMGKNPPFQVIEIPAYTLFNARLEKRISGVILYIKGENLLDKAYFAEPGFPMKARTINIGCRLDVK